MSRRKGIEVNYWRENDRVEWMERDGGVKRRIFEYGDKVYRIMEIQKHKVDWLSK